VFVFEKVIKSDGEAADSKLSGLGWRSCFSKVVWSCGNKFTGDNFVDSMLAWRFDVSWWTYERL
jgi:hypothetical protein